MKRESLRADLILLFVAAIWGTGFVAQRVASRSIAPLTFNALRYLIGLMLLAVVLVAARRVRCTREELRGGLLLALIMTGAAWLQQAGVEDTTAARAGFFTGLYVLLVPLMGLAFGQRVRAAHLVGAGIAAGGLALLSGDLSGGLGRGDLLVIGCAVLWALHVVLTGHLAPRADAVRLAAVQFAGVAALSGALALAFERDQPGAIIDGALPLVYSGIFAIGIAFTLQIVGQRYAPVTHAAVLMSTEAVFAAIAGTLLLSESLNRFEMAGCGLMLMGCLVSQLWPHKRTPSELAEPRDAVR
jgi:drug/metabolite transporter (DMT)-like permease